MLKEPTIEDLAKLAGTSVSTVSRVLNSKRRETWASKKAQAERIRKIAEEIGYRPNAAARAMKTGKAGHLAVVVHGVSPASYESEIISGLFDPLKAAGVTLSVIGLGKTYPTDETPKEIKTNLFDGVFGVGLPMPAAELVARSHPCHILLDSNFWEAEGCYRRDERRAGAMALRALAAKGCKKTLFIGLDRWAGCHYCVIDREEGARDAAKSLGVEFKALRIQMFEKSMPSYVPALMDSIEDGYEILAWNYPLATWCALKSSSKGVCPGRDYSLACCEGLHDTNLIWPELSRVSFDRKAMGAAAADGMFAMISGKDAQSRLFIGDWIEGSTCASIEKRGGTL